MRPQQPPKQNDTAIAIAIAIGCSPEVDGKTLLLKTSHTHLAVPSGIKLELT